MLIYSKEGKLRATGGCQMMTTTTNDDDEDWILWNLILHFKPSPAFYLLTWSFHSFEKMVLMSQDDESRVVDNVSRSPH